MFTFFRRPLLVSSASASVQVMVAKFWFQDAISPTHSSIAPALALMGAAFVLNRLSPPVGTTKEYIIGSLSGICITTLVSQALNTYLECSAKRALQVASLSTIIISSVLAKYLHGIEQTQYYENRGPAPSLR